jgi:2-polyprenyl-3-methyl-5-hydroxy-6-metoxy-1,4-benzoquinol methylase
MSLRLERFHAFARAQLPSPPARLLEIGCGDGELALALSADGYDVTAIDPRAPEGAIFRRVRLEELDGALGFHAVVASLSLHHVESLRAAFDKVAAVLQPRGTLVLQEFARERLSGATARWYHEQLRARNEDVAESFDEWSHEAEHDLADVHPFGELRRELDRLFVERELAEVPYLYAYRLDDDVEPVERALIEAGAIEATGVLYAGELGD